MNQDQLSQYHQVPLRSIEGLDRKSYFCHVISQLDSFLHQKSDEREKNVGEFTKNIVSIAHTHLRGGGTGILLNAEGFMLSCLHLVDHIQRDPSLLPHYQVVQNTGERARIDSTFFAYDNKHDLALLRVLGLTVPISPVFLAQQELEAGDKVNYFSFVDAKEIKMHKGEICFPSYDVYSASKRRLDSLAFEGEAQWGFSGAPLFNQSGALTGTLFGGESFWFNFATKERYIRTLVEEVVENLYHTT